MPGLPGTVSADLAALAAADQGRRHDHRLRLRRRHALDQGGHRHAGRASRRPPRPACSRPPRVPRPRPASRWPGQLGRRDHPEHRHLRPGHAGRWTLHGAWTGTDLNGSPPGDGYHQSGGEFTVTGTGDIAPSVPAGAGGVRQTGALVGAFAGLIAVIVVGTSFITAEYRRGLIDVTLDRDPASRPGAGGQGRRDRRASPSSRGSRRRARAAARREPAAQPAAFTCSR